MSGDREADYQSVERLVRMNHGRLRIPLSWVATTAAQPSTNFGDGLSAIIVSALSGIPVERANFDADIERVVAVGTIGHSQRNGVVHFWGTGVDANRSPEGGPGPYTLPPKTEIHVHALRGPESAATLSAAGLAVPEVYGDPVWLLPRLWPLEDVEKEYELGVVVHISELEQEELGSTAKAELTRYAVPAALGDQVRIINTFCEATPAGMRGKVREILSCKRILSTSLHGLVISEAYGVPCAWFAFRGNGSGGKLQLRDAQMRIDHRIRDFYRGLGLETMNAFGLDRDQPTDWYAAMAFLDDAWTQVRSYDAGALINAFPLPRRSDAHALRWAVDDTLFEGVNF